MRWRQIHQLRDDDSDALWNGRQARTMFAGSIALAISGIPLVLAALCAVALIHFDYPFGNHVLDEIWDLICLGIAVIGVALRALATGYGYDGKEEAPRRLNVTGIFSLMRHPHVLGTAFIYTGAVFFVHDPVLTAAGLVLLWVYLRRRMLERDALLHRTFEQRFEAWAANTPAVFPVFPHWVKPDAPFDWRGALLLENRALVTTALVFASLEVGGHFAIDRQLEVEGWWIVFLALSLLLAGAVFSLKRWSTFLNRDHRGPFKSPGA